MSNTLYRVDKFAVPETARTEFLEAVRRTHQFLRRQPGFVRDAVLEQVAGPGTFNFVTIAEWENQEAVAEAGKAIAEMYAGIGFDPYQFLARLQVDADLANYKRLDF